MEHFYTINEQTNPNFIQSTEQPPPKNLKTDRHNTPKVDVRKPITFFEH